MTVQNSKQRWINETRQLLWKSGEMKLIFLGALYILTSGILTEARAPNPDNIWPGVKYKDKEIFSRYL